MISIMGITLDNDMLWADRYQWTAYKSETAVTIGGKTLYGPIFTITNESGRPITLESIDGVGYQKRQTIDALLALPSAMTGELVMVNGSESITKTVRLRHEIDGGAIQFSQRRFNLLARADDWLGGQIFLAVL